MTRITRKAPNILLITIDSLRPDHLGCYGYGKDTSPNIDRLASKGALFWEAISNGGCTPHAFPSLLASALPPQHESEWPTIMRQQTTLAELLRKAGHVTAAYHSNPYLSRFSSYDKGFDTFEDNFTKSSHDNIKRPIEMAFTKGRILKPLVKRLPKLLNILEMMPEVIPLMAKGRPIITAQEISQQGVSWLKGHSSKFFIWLHYMDVHIPYMPPDKYTHRFHGQRVSRREKIRLYRKMISKPTKITASERTTLYHLYDADIRYVDDVIGWLLDNVRGRLANTIIIITADHGDEFGEHGRFSHRSVYDGIIRIPLIITGPGIRAGSVVQEQVSLEDLAPTIVELAGLGKVDSFRGKSLMPLINGETKVDKGIISTTIPPTMPKQLIIAYRSPEWKYIRTESLETAGVTLGEELYDLKSDPGETNNLHGTQMEAAKRFKLEAEDKITQFKRLKVEENTDYEKERVKERVRKLIKPSS